MIRKSIIILVLLNLIGGCGKKDDTAAPAPAPTTTTPTDALPCAGKGFLGAWYHPASGSLFTIFPNCTGVEVRCDYFFSFKLDPNNPLKADVVITRSNFDKGCLTTGTMKCDFYQSDVGYYYGTGEEFYLNCGFGLSIYQR